MTAKRPYVVLLLWLILSIFTLFQICWLFVISVKPAVDLFTTPSVILHVPYWKNYFEVFQDETLRRYMLNSVIISTGNATLVTTLAFFACYALSRYDLVGKASIFFGPSPTEWPRRRWSCCRSFCCSPKCSRSATGCCMTRISA